MAIKIEMLRCFVLAAQTGNLSDTAAKLGRTQSAVSMTLKQLEADLGQKLFQGERKNKLTPLGTQVFTLAQQQIQNFDATIREIQMSASAPTGLLRIMSIPSVVGSLIPVAVTHLLDAYPGLKVDVRDADTDTVVDALVRGQADIGIASGKVAINGMQSRPLFQDHLGLTCAEHHPFASQDGPIVLTEASRPQFIGNPLCQQVDHPEVQTALAQSPVHAHNTLSLIGMLQTGHWWTILPQTVVADLPGQLVFRKVAGLNTTRQVVALTPDKSTQPAVARDFVQMLCDQTDHINLRP